MSLLNFPAETDPDFRNLEIRKKKINLLQIPTIGVFNTIKIFKIPNPY